MDPLPGNQRVGRRLLGVVQVRAHPAPHVEHVPEPGGGEQRRARPVARQQGVGGDGAAVNDPFGTLQQLAEGEAQILGHEREAGHERRPRGPPDRIEPSGCGGGRRRRP